MQRPDCLHFWRCFISRYVRCFQFRVVKFEALAKYRIVEFTGFQFVKVGNDDSLISQGRCHELIFIVSCQLCISVFRDLDVIVNESANVCKDIVDLTGSGALDERIYVRHVRIDPALYGKCSLLAYAQEDEPARELNKSVVLDVTQEKRQVDWEARSV